MKKSLFGGLALLVIFASSFAGLGGGGNKSGAERAGVILDRQNVSMHSFSETDYRQRQYQQPIGTICPMFDDGDSSFATVVVAVFDSIRNGQGRFAGSTFVGADLRATCLVMPTQVDVGGGHMTRAQMRSVDGKSPYYELGSHGPNEERIGALGVDNTGTRVTIGGAVGMSRSYIDTLLTAYQDSAVAFSIKPFRSHGYSNWRMQLGMEAQWRRHGYMQAKSISVPVSFADSAVSSNEVSALQRNCDVFTPSMFGRQGSVAFQGFHTIGEPLNMYDIGARSSFDRSGADSVSGDSLGTAENLEIAIDMAAWFGDAFIFTAHSVLPVGASGFDANIDMSTATFYDLTYYLANKVADGLVQCRTFEQTVDYLRSYRTGELMTSTNFALLQDQTAASPLDSIATPLGFVPPFGSTIMFASGGDTLVFHDNTGPARNKVISLASADTIQATYTQSGDSLSYGLTDPTMNVMIQRLKPDSSLSSITNVIRISGLDPSVKMIQFAMQSFPAFSGAAPPSPNIDDNWYVQHKSVAFRERWMDNVNSGAAAYGMMADIVGGLKIGPTYTSYNVERSRVVPASSLFLPDTSVAGDPATFSLDNTVMTMAFGDRGRPPTYFGGQTGFDFVASWGNMRSLVLADSAQARHDNEWPAMAYSTLTNHYWYVEVPPGADYVYSSVGLEHDSDASPLGSNMAWVITNYSVTPMY
jgi:hypothetical protein